MRERRYPVLPILTAHDLNCVGNFLIGCWIETDRPNFLGIEINRGARKRSANRF